MAQATQKDLVIKAFEATSRAALITDHEGLIVAINPAFTALTAWTAAEAVGQSPRILSSGRQDADFFEGMWRALQGEGFWRGEIWNRHKDGEIVSEHLTIDAIRGAEGAITHYVAIFSGIEARSPRGSQSPHEGHGARPAFRDSVTGLPNRDLCADRLERALALARRRAGHMAVMAIDLDGFRAINDGFGHECGDLVLKAAGERLRACLRDSDTVARYDGDEFTIILPLVDGAGGVREIGLRMLAALRRSFVMAGDEIKLGGSIGAALFPADGESAEEIVAAARRVMQGMKSTGKGGFALNGDGEAASRPRRRAV